MYGKMLIGCVRRLCLLGVWFTSNTACGICHSSELANGILQSTAAATRRHSLAEAPRSALGTLGGRHSRRFASASAIATASAMSFSLVEANCHPCHHDG